MAGATAKKRQMADFARYQNLPFVFFAVYRCGDWVFPDFDNDSPLRAQVVLAPTDKYVHKGCQSEAIHPKKT